MATWQQIVNAEPSFASEVQRYFERHLHKTIATIRLDGSPRISGIEADFGGGHIWFGSMGGSRKVTDLLRDSRFALHSGSDDPPNWAGDAKVAGRAIQITDPELLATLGGDAGTGGEDASYFVADLHEVVLTRLGEPPDHLIIESWHEGQGLRRVERR